MSTLRRRGRIRRALIGWTAVLAVAFAGIPVAQGAPPAMQLSVDRTQVVVGAARLFTFTYTGGAAGAASLVVPGAFSLPALGADKSTGTIAGVGYVAASGGVTLTSVSGSAINVTLAGPGTISYFGRTQATGRNEFLFSVGGKRGRAVPVWGRAAKVSVSVSPNKRVASTTGTMVATALVTDVNGVAQDKVVLYFGTTLGATVFTGETDGIGGCSGSSVDGIVCTGAGGTAAVTFRTGTVAGCYRATASTRTRPSSYNGSGSFQVWPDAWLRTAGSVTLAKGSDWSGSSWLVSNTTKSVHVIGVDKWGNRANLTSGDAAWLERSSGTGTVHVGAATYAAGSCWGAPATFPVRGETAGTMILRGGLLASASPRFSASNLLSFEIRPGLATVVEVTTGTSPTHSISFSAVDQSAGVRITARDHYGNQVCFKASGDYLPRNAHLSVSTGDDTTGVTFGPVSYGTACTGSWTTAGYSRIATVNVISETDGTGYSPIRLYGYVNNVSSSTGSHWPYITVSWTTGD